MYWAKVENGIVTQVIVADNEVIKTYDGTWIETNPDKPDYAGIGWAHDGGKFIPPPPYEATWDGREWQPTEKEILDAALLLLSILGGDTTKIVDGAKDGLINEIQADILLKAGLIDESVQAAIKKESKLISEVKK